MKVLVVVCTCLVGLSSAFIFGGSGRQQAQGEIEQDCLEKARRGECDFYVCFDRRHPCESHNYALSYGWRFCDKISHHRSRFTETAIEWIEDTRKCSMGKMIEFYEDDHVNCYDVEQEMQRKHAECEALHGACNRDMLMDNKQVLMDVYTFSRKSTVRFLSMLHQCGSSAATDFLAWVDNHKGGLMGFFRGIASRIQALEDHIQRVRDSLPEIDWPAIVRVPDTTSADAGEP